jgi:hypothetical protein
MMKRLLFVCTGLLLLCSLCPSRLIVDATMTSHTRSAVPAATTIRAPTGFGYIDSSQLHRRSLQQTTAVVDGCTQGAGYVNTFAQQMLSSGQLSIVDTTFTGGTACHSTAHTAQQSTRHRTAHRMQQPASLPPGCSLVVLGEWLS